MTIDQLRLFFWQIWELVGYHKRFSTIQKLFILVLLIGGVSVVSGHWSWLILYSVAVTGSVAACQHLVTTESNFAFPQTVLLFLQNHNEVFATFLSICDNVLSVFKERDVNKTKKMHLSAVKDEECTWQEEIQLFASLICQDFISPWYMTISDEKELLQEKEAVIHNAFKILCHICSKIDVHELVNDFFLCYQEHLRTFQLAKLTFKTQARRKSLIQTKELTSQMAYTSKRVSSIEEAYEMKFSYHNAVWGTENEVNHLKSAVNLFLYKVFSKELNDSRTPQILLAEILTINVAKPVIELLSSADFLHECIILILSDEDLVFLNDGEVSCDKSTESETCDIVDEFVGTCINEVNSEPIFFDPLPPPENLCNENTTETITDNVSNMNVQLVSDSPFENISFSDNIIETLPTRSQKIQNKSPSSLPVQASSNISSTSRSNSLQNSPGNTENNSPRNSPVITPCKSPRKSPICNKSPAESFISSKAQGKSLACSRSPGIDMFSLQQQSSIHSSGSISRLSVTPDSHTSDDEGQRQDSYNSELWDIPITLLKPSIPTGINENDTQDEHCDDVMTDDNSGMHFYISSSDDIPSDTTASVEIPKTFQQINIIQTETATESRSTSQYTLYVVQYEALFVEHDNTISRTQYVKRRFREFLNLQGRLEDNPSYKKSMRDIKGLNRWLSLPFGNMDKSSIEKRRKTLEAFLKSLIEKKDVCNGVELKEFLAYDGNAHIAFVRKAPESSVQPSFDKMVKTVSDVFDKIGDKVGELSKQAQEVLPSLSRRDQNKDVKCLRDEDQIPLDFGTIKADVLPIERKMEKLICSRNHPNFKEMPSSGVSKSQDAESGFTDDIGLTDAVIDIATQALQGRDCWLCRERVVSLVKHITGTAFNSWLKKKIDVLSSPKMCAFYLQQLRNKIWPNGKYCTPRQNVKSDKQKIITKEQATRVLAEFFPDFLKQITDSQDYAYGIDEIIDSLQYEKLNKNFLYTFLDIVIEKLFCK